MTSWMHGAMSTPWDAFYFEMLAGEPPYTGPTAQVILARRFREPVPSVRVLRELVPEPMDRAITKALATAPADRYSTAAQFADALTRGGETADHAPVPAGSHPRNAGAPDRAPKQVSFGGSDNRNCPCAGRRRAVAAPSVGNRARSRSHCGGTVRRPRPAARTLARRTGGCALRQPRWRRLTPDRFPLPLWFAAGAVAPTAPRPFSWGSVPVPV